MGSTLPPNSRIRPVNFLDEIPLFPSFHPIPSSVSPTITRTNRSDSQGGSPPSQGGAGPSRPASTSTTTNTPTRDQHPHSMMCSEEVDRLVYSYCVESGYVHTSFSLAHESSLSPDPSTSTSASTNGHKYHQRDALLAQIVPPGHLVRILQKGLLYLEAEARYRGDPLEPAPRLIGYAIPNALPLPPLPKARPQTNPPTPTSTSFNGSTNESSRGTDPKGKGKGKEKEKDASGGGKRKGRAGSDRDDSLPSEGKRARIANAASTENRSKKVGSPQINGSKKGSASVEPPPTGGDASTIDSAPGNEKATPTISTSNKIQPPPPPLSSKAPPKNVDTESETKESEAMDVEGEGVIPEVPIPDVEEKPKGKKAKGKKSRSNSPVMTNGRAVEVITAVVVPTPAPVTVATLPVSTIPTPLPVTSIKDATVITASASTIATIALNSIFSSPLSSPVGSLTIPLPAVATVIQGKIPSISEHSSALGDTSAPATTPKLVTSVGAAPTSDTPPPTVASEIKSSLPPTTTAQAGPKASSPTPIVSAQSDTPPPPTSKSILEIKKEEASENSSNRASPTPPPKSDSVAAPVPEDKSVETDVEMSDGEIKEGPDMTNVHELGVEDGSVIRLRGHTLPKVQPCSWNPKVPALLATGGGDSTCRIWDVPNFASAGKGKGKIVMDNITCKHSSAQRRADVAAVAWDPSGSLLATGSEDGIARIWTVSGDLHLVLSMHQRTIFSLKWNSLGTMLLTGSLDNSVCLWDVSSGKVKQQWSTHGDSVLDVDWNDDNTFASASMDKSIHLFSISRVSPVHRFKGHRDEVNVVTFSPCKTLLASCSDDTTVRIWSLRNIPGLTLETKIPEGRVIDNDEHRGVLILSGHTHDVHTITWANWKKGDPVRLIASGSFDTDAKLWDADTGNCLHTFTRHTDFVYSLAFSPGLGNFLATGSNDGKMCVWNIKDKKLSLEYVSPGPIYELAWHPTNPKIAVCGRTEDVAVVSTADLA